ncbi:MAG: Putative hydrolase [Anaerolinea thermophila]|uniref:Putative hydrolase n=1 Tax=Anaerolinea thermophila TaxID=167964 RepID=A0A117LGT8_9CHLR|nr:MAG: Putative hydrolase [Anaerolinea thermophila]
MKNEEKIDHGKIDPGRIKAVLFDVDGTLSNTDDHLVARIASRLKLVSWLFKDRDPQKFARRLVMAAETPGNFVYQIADRLGIDKSIAKYYKVLTAGRLAKKPSKERFWLIPGVRDMLEALSQAYPMGVVSARDEGSTWNFLDHFELTSFFDVIVTSQTCRFTKPYPDPVVYAAKALGKAPEDCVMVGDTIVDVLSGKSAGAQTVAVLCGFGTEKELARVGADLILPMTPDIQSYLSS